MSTPDYEPILFHAQRPAAPLDRFIERLWYWRGPQPAHAKDRLLPNGAGSLIINLAEDEVRNYTGANDDVIERYPGAVLVGAHSRYAVIDAKEQCAVLGVSFRPGGMWPFFDAAPEELHNAHVGLRDLWGAAGASLRERILAAPTAHAKLQLLAAELLERALRPLARRPEIEIALRKLTLRPHEQAIAALSTDVGLSARRFTRLFTLQVGLTPKLYARIKRFELVVRTLNCGAVDWTTVAQHCGYFDQSHLIRDCKSLSGFTPTELAARRIGGGNHIAL
jgi:AraC-like DNA-binding protein